MFLYRTLDLAAHRKGCPVLIPMVIDPGANDSSSICAWADVGGDLQKIMLTQELAHVITGEYGYNYITPASAFTRPHLCALPMFIAAKAKSRSSGKVRTEWHPYSLMDGTFNAFLRGCSSPVLFPAQTLILTPEYEGHMEDDQRLVHLAAFHMQRMRSGSGYKEEERLRDKYSELVPSLY